MSKDRHWSLGSHLDEPESWTVTAGLLLTVPEKLVTGAAPVCLLSPPEKPVVGASPEIGLEIPPNPLEVTEADPDSPLMAASIAESIWGPRDLITASTMDSASSMEFVR